MKKITAIFCFLMTSYPLYAGGLPGGASELRERLANLNSINSAFQQTVYSIDGESLQQTSGKLQAARPGRVRWQTEPPMEQLVISDSQTLWIFDPDLEQVTIRPFDQDLSKTPAILFIGNLDTLEQSYDVFIEAGNPTHFTLLPTGEDSLYEKVALSFNGDSPLGMSLWDSLGQKTEIVFTQMQINQPLDTELFNFVPPEGVDILRDE